MNHSESAGPKMEPIGSENNLADKQRQQVYESLGHVQADYLVEISEQLEVTNQLLRQIFDELRRGRMVKKGYVRDE